MQTAKVPQIPANKCAGTAPTTSSSFATSSSLVPLAHTAPPMAPMITAQYGVVMSGPAVMATRPPMAPLRMISRSMRPNRGRAMHRAVTTPAAAAKLVFASTLLIATASLTPPSAS